MNKHFLLGLMSVFLIATMPNAKAEIGVKYKDRATKRNKPLRPPKPPGSNPEFILELTSKLHPGAVEDHLGAHVDQAELEALPAFLGFVKAFEDGDELFEINYNIVDGAGVNVGNGKRFTTLPRLDLDAPNAWANVQPHRITGPNSDSCISCHNLPVPDGAGAVNSNTVRIDPQRLQSGFIERQTPHIFGMGAVQLLAEEMTSQLHMQRDDVIQRSCNSGRPEVAVLQANEVKFGRIVARCHDVDYRKLSGVDTDLIVKPFEWKGLTAFVRDFVRGASHQELGMQASELVGDMDSDFDGVTNELSVGDITALAIYNAAQPRPVTKLELHQVSNQLTEDEREQYGVPLEDHEIQSIQRGALVFENLDCGSCHTPSMTLSSTVFYEPSRHPAYRDQEFPAGASVAMPEIAIQFDLTSEILDNNITLYSGQTLGQFERNDNQQAIVRLYGDLKRHDMGRELAEEIDEGNVGASVFLTENLWGVGSTPPYLHDGRATTLTEAVLFHGGEARRSKDKFVRASAEDKLDLIAFLESLVLFLDE